MKQHGSIAEGLFKEGYNCAQAVLIAFGDLTGLEQDTAAKLASSFGGGFGRMREICGAVSGAGMVLGIVRGNADPTDNEAKKTHYALIQEFARRFKEQNGSVICRELLSGVPDTTTGGEPEPRTQEYYRKRPCPALVRQAAEILDAMLSETA